MAFGVRHFPPLAEVHVPTGEAIAAKNIARAALAGACMDVIGEGSRGIGKNAYAAVRLLERAGLWNGDQLAASLLVPVAGPELSVIDGERETGSPAGQTGELPATDEGIDQATAIA